MKLNNEILTILFCVALPMHIMLVGAGVGICQRIVLAEIIFKSQEEGRFRDLSTGQTKRRMRVYGTISLVSLVLFIVSGVVAAVGLIPYPIWLAAALILFPANLFGVISAYRELISRIESRPK